MTYRKTDVKSLEQRFPDMGISLANWDVADNPSLTFCHIDSVFPTVVLEKSQPLDLPYAEKSLDVEALTFMDLTCEQKIDGPTFLNRRLQNDALLVMHKGQVVHESYRNGMTENDLHINMSTSKSYVGMIAAQAVLDGNLNDNAPVGDYIPELADSWVGISVRNLMDMSSGLKYSELYTDPEAEIHKHGRASGWLPAEGQTLKGSVAWALSEQHEREAEPGERFNYNSSHTDLLAYIVEQACDAPFCDLLENLLQKCGIESDAEMGLDRADFPLAEGAISMTLRDFARSAYLMASRGVNVAGERVLDAEVFDATLRDCPKARATFSKGKEGAALPGWQYRNQFWVIDAEAQTYCMLGVHGQFAYADVKNELFFVGYGSYSSASNAALFGHVFMLWEGLTSALV